MSIKYSLGLVRRCPTVNALKYVVALLVKNHPKTSNDVADDIEER